MSYTSAQIIQQNKIFYESFKSGRITYDEYVQVAKFQKQALADAYARENKPTQQTQQPKVSSRVTFMPPEPGTPQYALQGSYAQQGSTVYTAEGEKVGVVGSPNMPALTPGESYQVEPPQAPVKQQDLGLAAQADIAFQLGLKATESVINQNQNPVIREAAKAELNYAVAPILGGVAGGAAVIESNVYNTASLAKSVGVSIQTGKPQYSPVKTPLLAPTVLGGAISGVMGNTQEIKQINAMPGLYGVGYGVGSALTEVGLATVEGVGIGFAAGKASSVLRTVVNPRVNQFAESVLARSKVVAQSGLNRVSPGLGVKAEIVYNRDVARVASKIDNVDASLIGKANAARLNVKYGLTEPLKGKISFAYEKATVKAAKLVPEQVKEAKLYTRSVMAPNLAEYSTPFRAVSSSIKSSELYQGTKFTYNQLATKAKLKVPVDLKVPINQATKGKYLVGKIEKDINSSIKPVTVSPKATRGVTSNKNIDSFDALKIATKRKGQLRGAAYDDTFKMNRGSQVVKQVQKQSVKVTTSLSTKSLGAGLAISGAPSLVRAYPGTQRTRFTEDLEITAYPKSKADLKVTRDTDLRLVPSIGSASRFSGKVGFGSAFTVPNLTPTFNQKGGSKQDLGDIVIPVQRQPQTQIRIPQGRQSFTPKQALKFSQSNALKVPKEFGFNVGGGFGVGGGSSSLTGRWKKQNNPVKEWDKVLKSGLGVKVNTKTAQVISKIDRNSYSMFTISKTKRRSKRKS